MLTIRVEFFGELAQLAGSKKREVTLSEGSTLDDFFEAVAKICSRRDSLTKSQSDLFASLPHMDVLVNGRSLSGQRSYQTKLNTGDVVQLLPVVAGG